MMKQKAYFCPGFAEDWGTANIFVYMQDFIV